MSEDEELEPSGRFIRVPVEFVDRTLHPWMESAVWRETYIRLHRNRTFQRHKRQIGRVIHTLNEGQLLISIPWLQKCCPGLSEKSARLFIQRLEEEGLISYPNGRKPGAKLQLIELAECWTPTRDQIRQEKERRREARRASSGEPEGRGRKPRLRWRRNRIQRQEGDEGRGQEPERGEVEDSEASMDTPGASSGTETEVEIRSEGEVVMPEIHSGPRGLGLQPIGKGEVV